MLISQRPELTEEYIDTNRSRFIIEPLEPGFGYTLGNSLRRTLLSSIPGAAVTSIKIDGVLHEFTSINGVKENVLEIILNIKDLVLSSDSDEPVVMQLAVEGPGDVTAGDIEPPGGVEIHNPDLHIATLNDTARLEMELVVERGRGYVPAAPTSGEIGRIPVDQIYSPVLKVTYKGKIQAEVKAAVATETAESEQLKRQVVEARMAAMQAQVEPHFLFNTLASIDHLIETDPPRASQMQKNLIALLRASMPSMRPSMRASRNR